MHAGKIRLMDRVFGNAWNGHESEMNKKEIKFKKNNEVILKF